MINANMRSYDYYLYNVENSHAQRTLSAEPQGKVKMSIFSTSQSVQNNILYFNAQYIGLTQNKDINDTYAIKYGDILLKVLYCNTVGRYKQVFMAKVK